RPQLASGRDSPRIARPARSAYPSVTFPGRHPSWWRWSSDESTVMNVTRRHEMARISLNPPPTLSYRIGEWFLRRQFGEVLDPFRAMSHNTAVAQAFVKLDQRAAKWKALDPQLRDLADLAAAVKIGCPWCMDFGYWILHSRGIPREKIEAV